MSSAKSIYANMKFNGTHVLTVSREYNETNGVQWDLLHGTGQGEGFRIDNTDGGGPYFRTRADALKVACDVMMYGREHGGWCPIVAYEHGHRNYRWLDRAHYAETGEVREN